jgi:predicted transcriptional regulator
MVTKKKGAGRPIVRTKEVKEVVNDILQRMEQNPTKHTK